MIFRLTATIKIQSSLWPFKRKLTNVARGSKGSEDTVDTQPPTLRTARAVPSLSRYKRVAARGRLSRPTIKFGCVTRD